MFTRKHSERAFRNAKKLRADITDCEYMLWGFLRKKGLRGLKFRRQYPIGNYIVDFCCPSAKIVVEVDDSRHAYNTEYDQRRDEFLRSRGYKVIRVWNSDIRHNIWNVLEYISNAVDGLC